MKLFGGILPFIGWRRYQLTVTDMKEQLRLFLRDYPEMEGHTIFDDLQYGIEHADIYIFETFEVEFLNFKLLQLLRKREFVRFTKYE